MRGSPERDISSLGTLAGWGLARLERRSAAAAPGLAWLGHFGKNICCFQLWHGFRSFRGARNDPSRKVNMDERIFNGYGAMACRNIKIMLKNIDFGPVWGVGSDYI